MLSYSYYCLVPLLAQPNHINACLFANLLTILMEGCTTYKGGKPTEAGDHLDIGLLLLFITEGGR